MTKHCANPDCPGRIRDGAAPEFRDEIERCLDCGSTLMRGVAPDDPAETPSFVDLRTVFMASDAVQAHLVRGLIETERIRVHLKGEALSSAIGELPATVRQIEVQVDVADYEAAREIVMEFEAPAFDAASFDRGGDDES
jgi:hypothetical protein